MRRIWKNLSKILKAENYYDHGNILLDEYKVIYFPIAKVACSTFKKAAADLLGLTYDQNNMDDATIVNQSITKHRIILTRDIGILKHNEVQHGYYVRSDDPKKQIKEIIQRFDLKNSVAPFSRCLECNGELKKINKTKIYERLAPSTRKYYKTFFICNQCDKIYWKGSHYQKMTEFLREIADIDTIGR